MFEQLNGLLGISETALPTGQSIALVDISPTLTCDPAVFTHHFLHYYLKLGHRVVFLALSQTFLHYKTVCQKRAVNCNKAREAGALVFIEGLKEVGARVTNSDGDSELSFVNSSDEDINEKDVRCLHPLLTRIERGVSGMIEKCGDAQILVIVDDVSVLLDIGVELGDVLWFTHELHALVERYHGNVGLVIQVRGSAGLVGGKAASGRSGGEGDGDEATVALACHVCAHSDLHIHVRGLLTGCSGDVHGTLVARWPGQEDRNASRAEKVAQFKVEERNVLLFPVGTSPAVL